jgi:REP element-mobilizing transposase RayT
LSGICFGAKPYLELKLINQFVSAHLHTFINRKAMKIYEPGLYHIYNRGNNRQPLFYKEYDYLQFTDLCRKYIVPKSQILAWCLMPNHFHFLLDINAKSMERVTWGGNEMTSITNGFQLLQSSYAKLINNREIRTGSLFQQKTKAKLLETKNQTITTFRYIHQNPLTARLVDKMEDWNYSSYNEYCRLPSSIKLSNLELGKAIFELEVNNFTKLISGDLSEGDVDNIFIC